MPYLRFRLDLAIKKPLPSALQTALPNIKAKMLELKSYCEKINKGKANEENTIAAKFHICNHDIGGICDAEEDIV